VGELIQLHKNSDPECRRASRALLAAVTLALCVTLCGSAASAAQITTHSPQVVIAVAADPASEKAWYERGPWPIIGGVAALVVTNAVAVGVVYLQASRGFNAVLRQRQIEALSASLSDFYNPLSALLDINGEVFGKTGPPSFPLGEIERAAAALVWAETKKIILENNRRLLEILRTKTHRLHAADSLAAYNNLMLHLAMYETFQTIPTDLYRSFQFPSTVREHLADMRARVLNDFNALTGSQL
jgi:hypothetical protein